MNIQCLALKLLGSKQWYLFLGGMNPEDLDAMLLLEYVLVKSTTFIDQCGYNLVPHSTTEEEV